MTPTNKQLLDALEDVTATSQDLQATVSGIKSYGRTNRRYIRLLVGSLVFDILLSVGLGLVGFDARRTAEIANRNSNVTASTCRATNEVKKGVRQLGEFMLSFPRPADETPADRAVRITSTERFKTYITTAFAEKKCP